MGGGGEADDGGQLRPSYDGHVELVRLDGLGVITAVNEAWRTCCTANDGALEACGSVLHGTGTASMRERADR